MKIVAITEKGSYDGRPLRFLVDMTHEELERLTGKFPDRNIEIGKRLDVCKVWNDVNTVRMYCRDFPSMIESFRSKLDLLDKFPLPEFE